MLLVTYKRKLRNDVEAVVTYRKKEVRKKAAKYDSKWYHSETRGTNQLGPLISNCKEKGWGQQLRIDPKLINRNIKRDLFHLPIRSELLFEMV